MLQICTVSQFHIAICNLLRSCTDARFRNMVFVLRDPKLIYPKYYNHWLYTLAATIDCKCLAYFDQKKVSFSHFYINKLFSPWKQEKTPSKIGYCTKIAEIFSTAKCHFFSENSMGLKKLIWVLKVLGMNNFGDPVLCANCAYVAFFYGVTRFITFKTFTLQTKR